MDKLYSKSALIYKAAFCVMLAPLYALFSMTIRIEDVFLYVIVSVLPIGCLYTLPFWPSLISIKKYRVAKIGKYIFFDSLVCFSPALFGILFSEIITTLINGATTADGFATVIFFVIFSIVSLIFWILYLVFSKIK